MQLAIPFFGNRISNRLDCSENFLFVSIQNGMIKKCKKIRVVQKKPSALVNILNQLEVDVLICDGITEFYAQQLENAHIQVIPWISGEVENVLSKYLEGKLIIPDMDKPEPKKNLDTEIELTRN